MGFVIRRWKIGKLTKSEAASVDQIEGFKVQMQIAASSGDKFQEVTFLVDTGYLNTPLAITADLASKLGIEAKTKQPLILADGSSTDMPVGECSIIFGDETITGVPVGLNSPIPVIGYQLVAKMKFYTQSGQIVFADWDGTVKGLEPEGSN